MKALLPLAAGETFLSRIIRTLREGGADDVIVVAGHDADAIRKAVEREQLAARIVENADYAQGQLSSLMAAIEAVDRPGVLGLLVTLVDVPLVSSMTVRAVLEAYRRTGAPIVRPARHRQHGHPVLFDRSLFAELRRADAAVGAKAVLRARQADIVDVAVDDEGAFLDIDTPEEYARIAARLR